MSDKYTKQDFSELRNFIPEVVNEFKDIRRKKAFEQKSLANIVTFEGGIRFHKEVGYMGRLADIGRKSTAGNCKFERTEATIQTEKKEWKPRPYKDRLVFCAEEYDNTVIRKLHNDGIGKFESVEDFYFAHFQEDVDRALVRMVNRMYWMADSDAKHSDDSPVAGRINPAKDLSLYTMSDGLFKRARVIAGNLSDNYIQLDQNDFTKEKALQAAKDAYYEAPFHVKANIREGGATALCTLAFFDKLSQNFKSFELESMRVDLENGMKAIRVEGVNWVPVLEWDDMILEHEGGLDKYRFIITNKENMLIGVPSVGTWDNFETTYDRVNKEFLVDIFDEFDTQFEFDNYVMVGM